MNVRLRRRWPRDEVRARATLFPTAVFTRYHVDVAVSLAIAACAVYGFALRLRRSGGFAMKRRRHQGRVPSALRHEPGSRGLDAPRGPARQACALHSGAPPERKRGPVTDPGATVLRPYEARRSPLHPSAHKEPALQPPDHTASHRSRKRNEHPRPCPLRAL